MEVTKEEIIFYDDYYSQLIKAAHIAQQVLLCECEEQIEHFKTRIKTKTSVVAKLERLNYEPTKQNAIEHLNDIIGIRIVCRFLSEVYEIAEKIEKSIILSHILSKDYIKKPKESGYRSYHIILAVDLEGVKVPLEIQIRTISQDSWASLEHKIKYKKEISNENMIKGELKRLAGEMASIEICMQTLKELINNDKENENLINK